MQFVFLLLFNVFLGAVLYLVISLKLERSATEFRERRFRKEMDEIIKEFNITAERNISLLESRIRTLRRLMEKSGDISSLDITLDEEEGRGSGRTEEGRAERQEEENRDPGRGVEVYAGTPAGGDNNGGALIKKGLLILFEKIIDILPLRKASGAAVYGSGEVLDLQGAGEDHGEPASPREAAPPGVRAIIEKDMTLVMPRETAAPAENRRVLTAEEISEIVATTDDRYKLVSVLFDGGCDVEDISRYAGIPAGEVRLVVNLNRSRDSSNAHR